jgi:hypothetical protein
MPGISVSQPTTHTAGGQELFYPTHEFFLSGESIYLVCFNLVKSTRLNKIDYWLKKLRHIGKNGAAPLVVLVGTHRDDFALLPERDQKALQDGLEKFFDSPTLRREYPRLAERLYYLSCVTGDGMKDFVSELTSLLKRRQAEDSRRIPKTWLRFGQFLNSLKEESDDPRDLMQKSWKQFVYLAQQCGLRQEEVRPACEFFHDTGLLILVARPLQTDDIVLLKPQSLASVLSDVVGLSGNFASLNQNGTITRRNLELAWNQYPKKSHPTLLAILDKFEISFRMKDATVETYCIPSLLPTTVPANLADAFPEFPGEREVQVCRLYQQSFLPLGFFYRYLVRLEHLPNATVHFVWRNGILLSSLDGSEKCLVGFQPSNQNILVKTRTGQSASHTLHAVVLDVLSTMLEAYPAIDPRITMPCPHCIAARKDPQNVFVFSYGQCIKATNTRLYCRGIRSRPIRVDLIAPDIVFGKIRTLKPDEVKIVRPIAKGGLGMIYLGRAMNREVAIKEPLAADQVLLAPLPCFVLCLLFHL